MERAVRVRRAAINTQLAACEQELAALAIQINATRRSWLEAFYKAARDRLPAELIEELQARAAIDAGEEGPGA
jgi:hypothetical protein